MKNAFALVVILCAAAPAFADQWDMVADKKKRSDWDAMSFRISDAEQPALVFYGSKDQIGKGDLASDKTGYKGSVPLFEATFSKPDASQKGAKFAMKLKPTPYRLYVSQSNEPEVICVGKPCPTGTISLPKRVALTDLPGFKALKLQGVVPASVVAASLDGAKPAGPAYVEPDKIPELSAFEKALNETLLGNAPCTDEKKYADCRAALATQAAAYKAPADADLTAKELAYIKARLGDDTAFQGRLAWNKKVGGKTYSDFVAKYRQGIVDEANAYGKADAAARAAFTPSTATAIPAMAAADTKVAPPTGLEAEIALAYKKDDVNTAKFRELLLKLAQADDGGKPAKPLNNLAQRLEAAKKNPADYLAIQKAVMEDVQGYLTAKDPAKYPSKFGLQKAGIDDKTMLGAACTPNMAGAGAAPKVKKDKALDQAKGAAGGSTSGIMDGALWGVQISGPNDPLVGRCSKYFSDEAIEKEKQKTETTNGLTITEVPPAGGKEEKDKDKKKQVNDGKALDNDPDEGPSKVGDHVRAGATLGLGFGIISLVALMAGPIGWAYVAAATATGFGIGYGLDAVVNKK